MVRLFSLCGKEMEKEGYVLTSYPAQYVYVCKDCGEKVQTATLYPYIDDVEVDKPS